MSEQESIVPVTFMLGDTEYESHFDEDIKINRGDLSTEFAEHPASFGFYATTYEMASDLEQRMKAELERAYALLDVQARNNMVAGGIKPTEAKVKNVVITHRDYIEKQSEYFDAKTTAALLKAQRDAMIHRKDCLVSLGANLRAEAASNPVIMQDHK